MAKFSRDCFATRMTRRLLILMTIISVGYGECPLPAPVDGLVQFIAGVDISTLTGPDSLYPVGTRVRAQCSSPGEMRLAGNRNGQQCRADGTWSGQPPSCHEVNEQISVLGGAVQSVTPEGYLNVYVTANTVSVQVRCTSIRNNRQPQIEALHIQVDDMRVNMGLTTDGRGSYITLSPALSSDSGEFKCKKAAGNGSLTRLSIKFYEMNMASPVRQPDCPSDIVQSTGRHIPGANVTWQEPVLQVAELNKTHSPGDMFPIGVTSVVYTTRTDGNDVCRFTVTVVDTEVPTFLMCPADVARNTDLGSPTAVVDWASIVALDNSLIISAPEGNYQPGHAFPTGTTQVSYVARDKSGNENFCNFTVTVTDNEPPTIHNCPLSVTASITNISMDYVNVYWVEPEVTDNTELFSLVPSRRPGDRFIYRDVPTEVVYTARDTSKNENICVFHVTVLDKVSPVFSDCPADTVRYLGRNETTVAVFWRLPAPGDNVDIAGPTVPSHTPGQRFGLGNHKVTYVAWDSSGNNGTCVFYVTVKEAQCAAELTPFPGGKLTWTSALPFDLVPSLEQCSVYTENAGRFLALRECIPDAEQGAVWLEPRHNNCGDVRESIDLNDLTKVAVGEGNVIEVSQAVAKTVSNMSSDLADNLEPVANILQNIVNAGSSLVEVTKAVIETVDSVMLSVGERDALYGPVSGKEAPSFEQASSSIVQSLEAQISLVAGDVAALEIERPSLAVSLVTLQVDQRGDETQFLSVLNEDDPDSPILRNGGVRTIPKGERGDNSGVFWPIDTAITLPSNIATEVENVMGYGNPRPLRVSFVIYQTDALFASRNLSGALSASNSSGELFTSGRVISATVEGVQLKNLAQPVVVEFTPHQEWNDSVGIAHCVFWDFSLNNGTGDWSSDGCQYAGYEDDRIVCHCNHLTNFAVIMGMKDSNLTPVAQFLLDFISAVGCSLSIAGVSLTLFTFMVFGNLRASRSRQILMHLCFSLLCLYVVFLSGIDASDNGGVCVAVAVVIHFFTLTSMFWMGVEAHNMYQLLVKVFKGRESRFMVKACSFAWGAPLIIVAVTFGVTFPTGAYRHQDFCFLTVGPAQYYGLLLPIGLILLHNLVIFVLVVRSLVKNDTAGRVQQKQQTRLEKLSRRLQNAVCMSILLGLSWGFGFLSITLGAFVYQLLFCLANSVQGFLVFVLFCVRSADVRKAWRGALPIECNLRGQTYKVQERARTNVFAVDTWNCPAKLAERDGPGLDVYMFSWSGDGSSKWEDSKYISYTSQMSQISNSHNAVRPFSIYSSENGTVGRKKMSLS